jgi:hypothetical protein
VKHLSPTGPVIGTSKSDVRKGEIEQAGAKFFALDLDHLDESALGPVHSVTMLVPPGDDPERAALRVRSAAVIARGMPLTVVVSTAIYGDTRGTITERNHPSPRTEREKLWALLDASALALRQDGHDVAVVRTPAIYGPGRDHRAKLLTHEALVIKPAPITSRIHVEDLAAVLARMTKPHRPPLVLACDDMPAPTWRVVEEAARLLGLPPPRTVTPEEAPQHFSETALAMHLAERSCRSLVLPWLGVRLRYPTYREGLKASLVG